MGLMAVLAQDGQRWARSELLPALGCLALRLALAHVLNRLAPLPSPFEKLIPEALEQALHSRAQRA